MADKKLLTALAELATALIVVSAQDPQAKARFYLSVTRASMWTAERFGRLAGYAYNKYSAEVNG